MNGNNAPWWVAAALGVITVVLAAARAWDYLQRKFDERRERLQKLAAEADRLEAEAAEELIRQRREARRDATQEAWEVVDRLTKEVEAHDRKIDAIEKRAQECEEKRAVETAEHAATRAILRMLVTWAQRQRNPPPIPDNILVQMNAPPHPPAPPVTPPAAGGGT